MQFLKLATWLYVKIQLLLQLVLQCLCQKMKPTAIAMVSMEAHLADVSLDEGYWLFCSQRHWCNRSANTFHDKNHGYTLKSAKMKHRFLGSLVLADANSLTGLFT